MEDRSQVLEKELGLINSTIIKEWTKATLNNAPDYFYKAQASSTGQYHPQCTIKVGGLITHVKRAVYIANRLCSGYGIIGEERDMVLSATILHDIAKVGKGTGSYADYENHPLNAEKYFAKAEDPYGYIPYINRCIRNHMGLWTPAGVKKPITEYSLLELVVYTADYMATTKDLITPKDND